VSLEPQFALFHTLVMSFHLLTQVQQKKTETTNPAEYQLYSSMSNDNWILPLKNVKKDLERLLHRPNFSLQLLIEKLYHLPQLERGAIYYPLKLTADQVRGVRAALSSTYVLCSVFSFYNILFAVFPWVQETPLLLPRHSPGRAWRGRST